MKGSEVREVITSPKYPILTFHILPSNTLSGNEGSKCARKGEYEMCPENFREQHFSENSSAW